MVGFLVIKFNNIIWTWPYSIIYCKLDHWIERQKAEHCAVHSCIDIYNLWHLPIGLQDLQELGLCYKLLHEHDIETDGLTERTT